MARRLRTIGKRGGPNGDRDGHLFQVVSPLRKMVVLVDAATVDPPLQDDAAERPRRLLEDLLAHSNFTVLRYANDGPPPGTQSTLIHGQQVYPGWVTLQPLGPKNWQAVYGDERTVTHALVPAGDAVMLAERDTTTAAYADATPAAAAARRRSDVLAEQVVQAVRADLFITDRAYLHAVTMPFVHSVCDVDDALAVIGLYQRVQGEYRVSSWMRFNRGLFTWVATRELLPSAWRWYTATIQHSTHVGDDTLSLLANSLLPRAQGALVERDKSSWRASYRRTMTSVTMRWLPSTTSTTGSWVPSTYSPA